MDKIKFELIWDVCLLVGLILGYIFLAGKINYYNNLIVQNLNSSSILFNQNNGFPVLNLTNLSSVIKPLKINDSFLNNSS